jgi:hypothetical protein
VVPVYELFGGDAPQLRDGKRRTREEFEAGVAAFHEGRHGDALACMERVLATCPADRAARLYRGRIEGASDEE